MTEVHLLRLLQDERQTLGVLIAIDQRRLFTCKTLELSWKHNLPGESCIPEGSYECIYTRSGRLSSLAGRDVYTYEVFGVPGRKGIRIHAANYFHQLQGCIALGSAFKDLNLDERLDLIHSGETLRRFHEFMRLEPFNLIVRNNARS
jgi:hypothetical protein